MPKVSFQSGTFPLEKHESVLDCLLRNGKHIPYACKAGMCQACLVRSAGEKPPEQAGKWVKKSLQDRGYCLACQWVPERDVEVTLPTVEEFSVEVKIAGIDMLNAQVARLRLVPTEPGTLFAYRPGQYLTLINPPGIARSYSIANDFEKDGFIDLHIGKTSHGVFTQWLFEQAFTGDVLHARGPAGDCYYTTAEAGNDFPIILAGTGTGLAPLVGIVHDALSKSHQGPITLFHGGRDTSALYYTDELKELAATDERFTYVPVCRQLNDSPLAGCQEGELGSVLASSVDPTTLPRAQIYLCGNPDFVHRARKLVFLKGARSNAIFCDPFLERTVVPDLV